jgi:hypothetical protein
VARTFGTEEIFGRPVQKGIAARVLEYANQLLLAAYEAQPVLNADGEAIGYEVVTNADGEPVVRYDSGMDASALTEGCLLLDNAACTCEDNRACMALREYVSVPMFLRQAMDDYNMIDPEREGLWD